MVDDVMDAVMGWLLPMQPGMRTVITWSMVILMPIMLGIAWYALASIVGWSIRHAVTSVLRRSIVAASPMREPGPGWGDPRPVWIDDGWASMAVSMVIRTENLIGWLEIAGLFAYVALVLFIGFKMNTMIGIML